MRRRLVFLFLAEAGVVAGLHALGPLHNPVTGLVPLDTFAEAVRWLALAVGWWLLLSSVLYAVTSRNHSGGWNRIAGAIAPRVVRAVVDRALVVSLAASSLSVGVPAMATEGILIAQQDVSPVVAVEESSSDLYLFEPAGGVAPPVPSPGSRVGGEARTVVGPPEGQHEAPDSEQGSFAAASAHGSVDSQPQLGLRDLHLGSLSAGTVVVAPGDSMWALAEARLGSVVGDPGASEVARYWAEVVEANRISIRSGDPDLIFPGETLWMPAYEAGE